MTTEITTQAPAIDKATRIFHFIAKHDGATYTQIYQGLSLPQSSTSALLASLVTNGLLRQNEGKYFLGLVFYEFGNNAIKQFNIKDLATEPLLFLRDKTQLACHLGVLDGNSAIYLAKVESPSAIQVKSWLGRKLSLHSSALGKTLLAWEPEQRVDDLFPNENLPIKTQNTITTKTAYKNELKKIREQGWAFDNAEDFDEVTCLAAPVYDKNGKVIAAISTSGVRFQMPNERINEFVQYLLAATKMLSDKIRS
ncbi:IclR family transcriptional regulator [Gilliamella sp. App6-5]|uniref:IclR family transcriptional regulator n=1 Tax=Gilliamella sp. App6-5 TaxID=3120232 RepID=UPI00080EBA32|nr:IclR family transcriptional regulator [Gilliamella apicola]OCG16030.1 IclR family transcriptional regulator [Gilliamella apicola]